MTMMFVKELAVFLNKISFIAVKNSEIQRAMFVCRIFEWKFAVHVNL